MLEEAEGGVELDACDVALWGALVRPGMLFRSYVCYEPMNLMFIVLRSLGEPPPYGGPSLTGACIRRGDGVCLLASQRWL